MQSERHSRPLHIFLSFAHEDRAYRDALDKHLTALQLAGLIDGWYKQEILPGSEWQTAVDEQLDKADIILLFITPDYIASDYLYSVQMKKALEKHDAGIARVIPILFRPTSWFNLPFAKLQALPKGGDLTVSESKNKDRTYVKIIEELKRVIEELTGRASSLTPASPRLWNVPYKRNPFFTARDALLLSLHNTFTVDREEPIATQAISGLGGIGKTQIALEYAYRYRGDYHAIFWLTGDTPETLRTDFIGLATLLNLPERNETDQRIVIAAIKRALSQVPRWLIIIDNLDAFEHLDELIPDTGRGDILITTRRQATGAAALLREAEKMTLDEGALFLLRRAKKCAHDASLDELPIAPVEAARTICRLVDGLPLALDQAGAYIEETKIGLPGYARLYQKREAALLKQRGKFSSGHPGPVATTLALCIAEVRQHNPACIEILNVCAFLHSDAIPIELFHTGAPDLGPALEALISDELEFNGAIGALLDFSLLRRHSDTETLSIHRLVQVVLRDEMQVDEQRLWAERAIKALARLFPEPEPGVWQQCQQYLPHALHAADLIEQLGLSFAEAARLLRLAARYLHTIASYVDAHKLCEQALAIDKQVHGENHPETARTLHCLGNIYESLGDYSRAQSYYEQALEIGEHAWGAEDPDTATILNDLGEHFQTLGQFPVAEEYYRRALAIRQKIFGSEHPATASSLNNVGGICEEQGRYAEAQTLYEQALRLRERLRGPQHPDTAESYSNVARFYRVLGKYVQARPLYEQAITAYEHALGPEHPRVATCYNNFAVFCLAIGQYTRAEQLLARAIEIRTQCFGLHHLSVAGSWNNLALAYTRQGHYDQALPLYERALSICEEKKVGREHPSTVAILINMGEFYLLQGDYPRAEVLLTEALASITKGQEPKPPRAAPVLNILGKLFLARAGYEQAERFLNEALEIRQKALGKTHPETGMSLKSLGDLALARNDNAQAEALYREALDIVLEPLGSDHPDVNALVERLVDLLQKMGREDDARSMSERVRKAQDDNGA